MHFNRDLKIDEIRPYLKYPVLEYNTFSITQEILDSDLFPILELALSFENTLRILKFQGITLISALNKCSNILSRNVNTKKLLIEQCDLTNASQFKRKIQSNEIVFRICDATDDRFVSFFEQLSQSCQNIRSLSFDHSILESSSISSVFQCIFFNECFHHLEELCFDAFGDIPDLEMHVGSLAACSWAMTSKCVKKLSVIGCTFDTSSLLQKILSFDIGLQEIHLGENTFRQRIPLNMSPRNCGFLDLSRSNIGILAISSFIESVVSGVIDCRGIDLSYARMTNPEFIQMLALLSADVVVMPSLECFYFDGNDMDTETTKLIAQFIRHQPKLRRMSINSSVIVKGSNTGLTQLFDSLLSLQSLESLSMRGMENTMNYSCGEMWTPFLREIAKRGTMKYLDLTDQCVKDDCIDIILSMNSLEELWLDRCSASSFTSLSNFIKKAIDSNLKLCGWPHREIQRIKSAPTISSSEREIIEDQEKLLHAQFIERFSYLCNDTNETRAEIIRKRFVLSEPTYEELIVRVNLEDETQNKKDDLLNSLLNETVKDIIVSNGIPIDYDPISDTINSAKSEFSLDSLIQKYV